MPFELKEQTLLSIPGQQWGGNHRHPRMEAFFTLTDYVEIHWLDEQQQRHQEKMKTDTEYFLFLVLPWTPHVIINRSAQPAILLEMANASQYQVEACSLI